MRRHVFLHGGPERRVRIQSTGRGESGVFSSSLDGKHSVSHGTLSRTMSGSMISPRQIPADTVSGMKLAIGAVGTGHLQRASIISLQIKTTAIGQAYIIDFNINTAKIANAAVTMPRLQ